MHCLLAMHICLQYLPGMYQVTEDQIACLSYIAQSAGQTLNASVITCMLAVSHLLLIVQRV